MVDSDLNLLILDASCLLNLFATEKLREIVTASRNSFAVADYMLEEEALFIWTQQSADQPLENLPVDLEPLIEDGLIAVMSLESSEEVETFVDFAVSIDDGEAITAALAVHRACAVATDDRKARRVIGEQAPSVSLVSTLDLLKEWAETTQIPTAELRPMMEAMESGASYTPGSRNPLFEWWLEILRAQA